MRLTQGYKLEANSIYGLWHVENPGMFFFYFLNWEFAVMKHEGW